MTAVLVCINGKDIIIERTKETRLSSTCRPIPPTTIANKWVYASIRWTWYTQCRPTHSIPVQCWASVAVLHCWFNAGQSYSIICDAWPTLMQPKPFKLLTTNIIVNIFFFKTFKHESAQPSDLKRYIGHVHKDWCI